MTERTPYDFSDRVAVVTGAATGIGREAAARLAAAGAAVWILDVDEEQAEEGAAEIRAGGGRAHVIACDVSSAASVESAFGEIGKAEGVLDVLVNNAGGFWQKLGVEETTLDEWDRVIDLNLKGVFLCARAAIPLLRGSPAGRIINVGSLAGQTTVYRSSPPYAAAKAGVHALSRVLAYELAGDGITCNALAPSAILTDRILAVRGPEERARTEETIPLGRYGTPGDVVGVIMFLASEESGFVTGQTISVNGGRFMA